MYRRLSFVLGLDPFFFRYLTSSGTMLIRSMNGARAIRSGENLLVCDCKTGFEARSGVGHPTDIWTVIYCCTATLFI
jgi:hypothetical protein